jgi:hypothetical protein
LFENKRTVVRVYLSHYAPSSITVRGEILIRRSPNELPLAVDSENVVVVEPAHAGLIPPKRDDVSRSLNFVVPPSYTDEGQLHIEISRLWDTVNSETKSFACDRRPTVWFHATPPIRVRVLGMRYMQGTPPVTHVPSQLDFDLLLSWLGRAYPVSGVVSSTATIDANPAPAFTCGQINAQVAAIRAVDMASGGDERTHYYGLVSDGGFFMRGCAAVPSNPNPAAIGSGPTGSAAWGWDFDGSYGDWYTGHELGHTFGRKHPGFCGETVSDLDNFPFDNGQLANDGMSFGGFDVGDPINGIAMAALPGTQWHDVMTYCSLQWLSAYTYLGIRRRLRDEDALVAGSVPGPLSPGAGRPDERFPAAPKPEPEEPGLRAGGQLVSVVATANLTRQSGKIEYVNPLDQGVPSRTDEDQPVRLRALSDRGRLLAEYAVLMQLSSELTPEEDQVGIVDAIISVPADTRSIELAFDDKTADRVRVGGAVPMVRGVRQSGRDQRSVGFALEADELPEECSFSVQVTRDNGRTWETMAVGLRSPSFELDRTQFLEGDLVQVRVVATNGLSRSVVTGDTVVI